MASINYAAREISVKIVYYGPGLSGKTTNLQVIHRKVPPEYKSDMVSLATETDRTLFFDFLPLDLGKIKGFSTKFQLYTVPGQVYYNATRKLVLRGVDGIVFVADSAPDKVQENLESFQNLEENLAEYGYKRESIPIIIQYNKRDLPNAMSIEELQQLINKYNLPWSEAVANKGKGVFDSLKLIGKIVIDYLNRKYSRGTRTPEQVQSPAADTKRTAPASPDMYSQQPNPYSGNQFQNTSFGAFNKTPQSNVPPSFQTPFQQPARPAPQQMRPSGAPVRPQMPPQPKVAPNTNPFAQNSFNPVQGPNGAQKPPLSQPIQQPRSQQQNFNRSMPIQGMNSNPFNPPQPKKVAQPQQNFQSQPSNNFEVDSYDDQQLFEPQTQPNVPNSFNTVEQPAQNTNNYFDYGSISLESASNQQLPDDQSEIVLEQSIPMQGNFNSPSDSDMADFSQNQFSNPGKTDLDLEIEKYQKEIEEKQKKTRVQPSPLNQKAPAQFSAPNQNPTNQQFNQFQSPADENDYDVYNMEMPAYPQQQPPVQKQPALGNDDPDDAMFFTSVDTDRQKKPAKKPIVNPRTSKDQQQQKGFLSKFFNRDTP